MWEQLPSESMDLVLKMHDTTVRAASVRYHGYESATGKQRGSRPVLSGRDTIETST